MRVFCCASSETFILNYEDVDIKKVTQDIANFSKKTIILDPRVKGKVTIFSNSSLSSDEVWDVYLRTIQVNGLVPLMMKILLGLFLKMRQLETKTLENLVVNLLQESLSLKIDLQLSFYHL